MNKSSYQSMPDGKSNSVALVCLCAIGLLPGVGYFAILMLGMLFGVCTPAKFMVDTLLGPRWGTLLLYALVLGGSMLSAVLSLSMDDRQPPRRKNTRICGWLAVLLLIVNLPLTVFQVHWMVGR